MAAIAYYQYELNKPVAGLSESNVIEIRSGQSFTSVTHQLISEGILETPWVMMLTKF